jgi:hypothetical protein
MTSYRYSFWDFMTFSLGFKERCPPLAFINLKVSRGVPSSSFHQPKSFRGVRGVFINIAEGTPLGWCRFQQMQNLCTSNGKKTWYTLSIIYSINLRGCPPLGAISLGQAVDFSISWEKNQWWRKWTQRFLGGAHLSLSKIERWAPPRTLWVDEKWEPPKNLWADEKWEVGTP